jgi:hypothetical protein
MTHQVLQVKRTELRLKIQKLTVGITGQLENTISQIIIENEKACQHYEKAGSASWHCNIIINAEGFFILPIVATNIKCSLAMNRIVNR